ncbi:MAG: hypothetical protein KC486_13485 [Myxococcales bacterium]|nr:hypothetical protein [Myxococcales bacterium]
MHSARFRCPGCRGETLRVIAALELGPDDDNDEQQIQALTCDSCGFVGAGVYQESRRGAGEGVHHWGIALPPSTYIGLAAALAACTHPDSPACDCGAHRRFGARGDDGRRRPLALLEVDGPSFSLVLRR